MIYTILHNLLLCFPANQAEENQTWLLEQPWVFSAARRLELAVLIVTISAQTRAAQSHIRPQSSVRGTSLVKRGKLYYRRATAQQGLCC